MLDRDVFSSVANQLLSRDTVELNGKSLTIRRTSGQGLRIVSFHIGEREFQAIEQNPEKPSRWGQLARAGHKVVQFKDAAHNRFIAVAVDGKITEYGLLTARKRGRG